MSQEKIAALTKAEQAIDQIVQTPNTLLEFNVHAITEGIDAMGEVTVRIQSKDDDIKTMDAQKEIPYTRVFGGHGADTDIIVASTKAYLNALNKLIIAQTEGLEPVHENHTHGVMLG